MGCDDPEMENNVNFDAFTLWVKRGESPVARGVRRVARFFLQATAPIIPGTFRPVFRVAYEVHFLVIIVCRNLINRFYRHPLFQGRCAAVGKGLVIDGLPFVSGHTELHIGNDVYIGGQVGFVSGRYLDNPRVIVKDRAAINWRTQIVANREVIIEEDARVSFDCRISDSDGHPRQADLRLQNAPLDPRDIRAVRICRNAWIGNGAHIMKGVTVGEGAIVAANSVVISDIPPYALAMGNPAEVYFANYGRPRPKRRDAATPH